MAGTKMILNRYGGQPTYYDIQEVIIDEAYLAAHSDLIIKLVNPYTPGINMLEVYYNGQYLVAGGGYEEIDEYTIRLDIRSPEDRLPLTQFYLGDEIFIRIWKNFYVSGKDLYDERLLRLENEMWDARAEHPVLDSRLDELDRNLKKVIVFVIPGGRAVKVGVQKVEVRFPFKGEVVEVYASNRVPGTTRTVIAVEKISQGDFDGTSSDPIGWLDVFLSNLIINAGEKSSRTAPSFVIGNSSVATNDHFRVRIDELGDGIEDITVEVVVRV